MAPRRAIKIRAQEQVFRRIAAQGELRREDELRALCGKPREHPGDERRVVGEIPHHRVDLGQAQAQRAHPLCAVLLG